MGEVKELAIDELNELVDWWRELEDQFGWEEAVRMLAAFRPDPAAVRQVEHHAYHRAAEERSQYNYDAAGRFTGAGDALAVLAERVEQARKGDECRCCVDNECECVNGGEEQGQVYDSPAEVFAPEPWELGPEPLEMPSYGS